MTGRCHIDADGLLRGPINITHLLSPNRASGFNEPARGAVLHTEAGYEAGTVATFMNPANQVSAFFSVGDQGEVHQYMPVGHGDVAWTQAGGNYQWRGIECEDLTNPGNPLTAAQLTSFAQVFEALSAHDGFPLQVTDDTSGHGLIWHGAGGQAWGGHTECPGDVRKAQRPAIIELARAIRAGGAGVVEHVTAGHMSLAELAAQHHSAPATVLGLTAGHAPDGLAGNLADYINGVFAGTTVPSAHMPAGLHLILPA
jgi:N-acetylmuramoyl-L-alanine amidase